MPLPLSPALAEVLQRVHGRWYPKVELLTSSREHVRDYKEGMQQGTVSPANALEFSADGSVRLAAVASQQIGHATGTAQFTGLADDVVNNTQRALLIKIGTPTIKPLWIQQVRLHLHRRPDGGQPIFDGRFILHTFAARRTSAGIWELVPMALPVEKAASAITWSADEADVDFVLAGGAGVVPPRLVENRGNVLDVDGHHLLFVLTLAGGTNTNASWMHDTAEADGEITQNGHTLSWWNLQHASGPNPQIGLGVNGGPTKASVGGWYALSKATSLGRAAIFFRTTSNTTATLTFSGASAFDLGAAIAGDQEFVGTGETPLPGTSLVFEVSEDGVTWREYVDGDFAATDNTPKGGKNLTAETEDQTKNLRVTFNGSTDNLRTPVLRSVGMRDITTTDVSRLVEGLPDAFYEVSDLLNHRMEVGELVLRLVKHGHRADGSDLISELLSQTTNITAAHVRISIAAPGLDRKDELHVDTYRVDDYEPRDAGVDLICVSVLDRLKLPIPKRKLVSGNWVVEPAKYDTVAGNTITSVFTDVRDGVLGLDARYRGSVPQTGPTDAAGTTWSKVQGQIGAPGIGTAGRTESAKDVLEQLCRIAGGVLAPEQGKVHYRDLFGAKAVVAVFPEREITWESSPPGLRQRAPRALISFQPHTLGGNDWTKSIEREDAAILAAIEQAGTEAGLRVDQFPDQVSRWVRTANPFALGTLPADDAEGLADALVHRHVKAFGPGVLRWGFRCRIPHPHVQIGDLVAAENSRFVARDPITAREIRGISWAKAVVIGRNIPGTRFLIWLRAYSDISPDQQRFVSRPGDRKPLVTAIVEDVDGRPDQARIRLRSNPDVTDVTIRYKVLAAAAAIPEPNADGTVWTTYAGPFIVARDASAIQRVVAWGDWLGAYGPLVVAEIANDRRPQVLTVTSEGDASTGSVTVAIQGDADTGSIKFVGRKTGFPSLADVQARTAVDGRNVTGTVIDAATGVALVVDPNVSQTIYLTAVAYSRAAGAGIEGPIAQAIHSIVVRRHRLILTSGSNVAMPANWNSGNNTIEAIGGGGGGAGGTTNTRGGGGGGGGEYRKITNFAATPGQNIAYSLGAAGAGGAAAGNGGAGGDTSFNTSSLIAKGGGAGLAAGGGGAGGTGGTGAGGNNNGGAGAAGQGATFATGGGGGGAGGETSAGGAGSGGSGGNGGSPNGGTGGGGPGGNGSAWGPGEGSGGGGSGGAPPTPTAGNPGGQRGGGGGGGGCIPTAQTPGAAGAQGLLVLSWYSSEGYPDPDRVITPQGTAIQPSMIEREWDPRAYGAKLDGATDDTTSIQQAIDAAAAGGGGTVRLVNLPTVVSQLKLKSRVILEGGGWKHMITQQANSHTQEDSGTSSGGNTTTTLNDTSKAWGANQFAPTADTRRQVKITGGTGSGQIRTIVSNTGTQLVIDSAEPWTTTPDGTSTYIVVNPIHLIILDNANVEQAGVRRLKLYGNKANQVARNDGIRFDNTSGGPFDTGDSQHVIEDVLVKEPFGDGVRIMGGARETRLDGVVVQAAGGYGVNLKGATDSQLGFCIAQGSGLSGFNLDGTADRLVTCKAFNNGQRAISGNRAGFLLTQIGAAYLANCMAQENPERGFHLMNANRCVLAGCVADSNGSEGLLFDNADNNIVEAFMCSKTTGLAYTQPEGVEFINGSAGNRVSMRTDGVTTPVVSTSDLANNDVLVDSVSQTRQRVLSRYESAYGTAASSSDEHYRFGKSGSPASGNPYFVWKTDASSVPIGILGSWDGITARTFLRAQHGGGGQATRLVLGAVGDVNEVLLDGFLMLSQATPAQLTANQNDYNPGNVSWLRLSSDAARSITGIAGGAAGRRLTITNVGSNDISFTHEDAASSAANRIITPDGLTWTLNARESALLVYDDGSARWRILERV